MSASRGDDWTNASSSCSGVVTDIGHIDSAECSASAFALMNKEKVNTQRHQ
jgi:hypothetical protein